MTDAENKPDAVSVNKVRWPWLVEVSPMTDQEKLAAVGEYLRSETPQVSERLARAFGLTLDPWIYAKCAVNPGVLPEAMADFLEALASRLVDQDLHVGSADLPCFDKALAQQGEKA